MKFNFFGNISKLLDNKKFLAVFSIVLAVVFWLVIEIAENPSRDVTVSQVPITLAEQQDDNDNRLVPVGEYNHEVTVTVSGPGYLVGSINSDDVTVSVSSYAEVTNPGNYVLNLTASVDKTGCTITKISPSYVQVTYDFNTEASVPVEIDVSEFRQYETTDCKINRSVLKRNSDGAELTALSVSGPSEIIGTIAKAVVKPDISSVEGGTFKMLTSNFKGVLTFYDANGNEVDASLLTYSTDTYVRVVVYKTANVPLVPTFTNLPGYYAASESGLPKYSLSIYNETSKKYDTVESVTVRGPVDTVDALLQTGLQLAPIDFANVTTKNTKFNVSFVLAEGVEVVDGTEEITVSLNVGYLKQKTVNIDPSKIQFLGLGGGLTATTSYKRGINVVLCGKSAALSDIKIDDITVSVDCSSITAATVETKTLVVTVAGSVEAWAVSVNPVEVGVTVN